MNRVQEILTPLQVLKLLIWIDGNDDVLTNICPGWSSERIYEQKTSMNYNDNGKSSSGGSVITTQQVDARNHDNVNAFVCTDNTADVLNTHVPGSDALINETGNDDTDVNDACATKKK